MTSDRTRNRLRYQIGDGVRNTLHVDGGAVLNIKRGQLLRLNETASRMLQLLMNGRDEAEIADQLAVESGARPEVIAQDARHFFEELKSLGVLEECSVIVTPFNGQA